MRVGSLRGRHVGSLHVMGRVKLHGNRAGQGMRAYDGLIEAVLISWEEGKVFQDDGLLSSSV